MGQQLVSRGCESSHKAHVYRIQIGAPKDQQALIDRQNVHSSILTNG